MNCLEPTGLIVVYDVHTVIEYLGPSQTVNLFSSSPFCCPWLMSVGVVRPWYSGRMLRQSRCREGRRKATCKDKDKCGSPYCSVYTSTGFQCSNDVFPLSWAYKPEPCSPNDNVEECVLC